MGKEKILVIEDEEDILALVHYNLVKAGFRVDTATSGEEGLKKAKLGLPDLIVLDLMLPGCRRPTGTNTVRRIRDAARLAESVSSNDEGRAKPGQSEELHGSVSVDFRTRGMQLGLLKRRRRSRSAGNTRSDPK